MKNKMRKIYDFRRATVSMLCILLFLLCGVTATAQNREIGGTVLDETGQPAIGATVVVKGTNSMTITGLDGQFKLSVPKDAGQLEISYVGYDTAKITLGRGKNVYNVKLKVADLAAMIGTSAHTLSYLFNQHLNRNYYDYINDYRIAEFKHLIAKDEYSKYTLGALAELCGFSSRASFFRYFKKATGITPNEYIRSIGKTNE